MRIQKIATDYQIRNNTQSFKGFVNGKYYEDWIIKEAKEAFDNPKWRNKFLKNKKTVTESLKTWQDTLDTGGDAENKVTRVLMGIFSLGATEVGYGALGIIEDQQKNKEIDRNIEKIEDCMVDLNKEKTGR